MHTPGPWIALPEEVDKSYIRIRGTRLGSRYKIANVITPAYEGAHPTEAAQTRANAALIATAPELLAFARQLASCEIPEAVDYAEEARRLVNKAEGGAA